MLTLSAIDQARLATSVDTAVATGLALGGALGRPPRTEPEAVLAVFSTLAMATPAWRAIFAPLGLKVTLHGAFIHGTPIVSFHPHKSPKDRCELGDLLLVIDDLRTGHEDRRASIIQAKPISGPILAPSKSNEIKQLDLNMHWPPFEFDNAPYGGATFDFRQANAPGAVGDSGRYGAVDIAGGSWEQLWPAPAMRIGSGESLGVYAGSMLVGAAGREAEVPGAMNLPCSDDWSEAVRLLLRESAGKITSSNLGATDRVFSRWMQHSQGWTLLVAGDWWGVDGGEDLPPEDYEMDREEWEGGGMSTFRVIVSEADDPPRPFY